MLRLTGSPGGAIQQVAGNICGNVSLTPSFISLFLSRPLTDKHVLIIPTLKRILVDFTYRTFGSPNSKQYFCKEWSMLPSLCHFPFTILKIMALLDIIHIPCNLPI
jgi:hypothetical protein